MDAEKSTYLFYFDEERGAWGFTNQPPPPHPPIFMVTDTPWDALGLASWLNQHTTPRDNLYTRIHDWKAINEPGPQGRYVLGNYIPAYEWPRPISPPEYEELDRQVEESEEHERILEQVRDGQLRAEVQLADGGTISGVFMSTEAPNRNQRVYPMDMLVRHTCGVTVSDVFCEVEEGQTIQVNTTSDGHWISIDEMPDADERLAEWHRQVRANRATHSDIILPVGEQRRREQGGDNEELREMGLPDFMDDPD